MSDFGRTMPVNQELWALRDVSRQLADQSEVLTQLVELARLEHDARLAAEASARRWAWVSLILALLTLAAAVAAVVVSA